MIGGWRRRRREPVRPRLGQVRRADGTEVPVMFQPTEVNPNIFTAVDLDGQPIVVRPGDQVYADVVGPGQGLAFDTELPPG